MSNEKLYKVPAIAKALDVIEFISRNERSTFTEIYTYTGIPKSSAYQILRTLEARGYLRIAGDIHSYALGLRFFELGSLAVAYLDIRTEALPKLRELVAKINETANLGVLDGNVGVYVLKVEGTQAVRLNSYEGKRLALHCTAMGKILLAWREDLNELLRNYEFRRFTDNTITQAEKLIENLLVVRDRGWALDDQENEPHIRCVGAPIWDIKGEVCAALSVSGLANSFNGEYLMELSKSVMETAKALSKQMGATKKVNGDCEGL